MTHRKPTPKASKAKADILFSRLIREVGYCESCGKRPPEVQLQCAHWISRRYSNTRVDPDNAFCLCARCHIFFGLNPTDFALWAIDRRGIETYERLRAAANQTSKVDWAEQVELLKAML